MTVQPDFIRDPEEIYRRSFAVIEQELAEAGYHPSDEDVFAVTRRVIHATADFDFARILRFHPSACRKIIEALSSGAPIVTDVRMVQAGLNRKILKELDIQTFCYIDDPRAVAEASGRGKTVSMAAICLAAQEQSGQNPIFAIGNAPTALFELLELIREGRIFPAGIVGLPVGFVSVSESKQALMRSSDPPWISCEGRKGGSSATAAALNALLIMARMEKFK